jgi:N-acetylmuramoyl-L-alanine amidase
MVFDTVSGKDEPKMSADLNIIQDFIPKGRINRPGRVNPMTFITIHNTGNTSKGAGARNHANYVKGDAAANAPVSWHYTTDETDIYQHIPDTADAFHAGAGGGDGNRKSIGIEICMNSDGDLLGATDNAVMLTAHLCKKYNISIENVVQHNCWSGKDCPQLIRNGKPYDWSTFINKVKSAIVSNSKSPEQPSTPDVTSLDINNAVAVLVKHGVINTPEYWLSNYGKLEYLDRLIINMAAKLLE